MSESSSPQGAWVCGRPMSLPVTFTAHRPSIYPCPSAVQKGGLPIALPLP